jgi:hypothetical protein
VQTVAQTHDSREQRPQHHQDKIFWKELPVSIIIIHFGVKKFMRGQREAHQPDFLRRSGACQLCRDGL